MTGRLFIMLFALLLLLSSALGEDVQSPFQGTWEGSTVTLTLNEDGTGTWLSGGETTQVVYKEGRLYAGDVSLGTLRLEESFLIFTDEDYESWPLMERADALPGALEVTDPKVFCGSWRADFALVSGFKIALGEQDVPAEVVYEIEEGSIRLSGTGYENPVTLPWELKDGKMQVWISEEESWEVTCLSDMSLIRETEAMTLHLKRETE